MTFALFPHEHITLRTDRVPGADAERQEQSAARVLELFARQPGVVLADEVGMGKTFVAMAVAAAIVIDRLDQPNGGPVIVMVPSSLSDKWPKDWGVFGEKCLSPQMSQRLRHATAKSGIELLRLLDDDDARRAHIVFLTHGALHRNLDDSFVKLALLRRAFKGRSSLRAQRDSFPQFAARLLREESRLERLAPGLLGQLLETPTEEWLRLIQATDERLHEIIDDDPVPRHVRKVLEAMTEDELEPLVEELRNMPLRESAHVGERLKCLRVALATLLKSLWRETLKRAQFKSPLVILDEAHHLKNPKTRLASLFVDEEAAQESESFESGGALGGKFERMLFLTATPFQLGHGELLNVLRRFEGIRWGGRHRPLISRTNFQTELKELEESLNEPQSAALRFEKVWGRMTEEQLIDATGQRVDVDAWWDRVRTGAVSPIEEQLLQGVARTAAAMRTAETRLGPWVLRHLKSRTLPDTLDVPRRVERPGAAILDHGRPDVGLEIEGDALLPFLLAGRARSLFTRPETSRAYFAEGLAASFEAYLETRSGAVERDLEEPDEIATEEANSGGDVAWYFKHLDQAINDPSSKGRMSHPKVRATVDAAVRLWEAGEKLLIFCHYRATGRALRNHIATALHERIIDLGQRQLVDVPRSSVAQRLDDIGDRFFDTDGSLRREVDGALARIVSLHESLSDADRERIVIVCRRFLRTPAFLVRYFDLTRTDRAAAFVEAIERDDLGGQSLRGRLDHFCRFLSRLTEPERIDYLDALSRLQPGSHIGGDIPETFESSELEGHASSIRLPNVRLANGTIKPETRRRLLLAFNAPLFPEILIASSVLAEGVDLHLNCRHVVHHDLYWNPSVLEQRTGRVDRLGAKAERVGKSIEVYLPYVSATQDEKMFRVVRDRDRWFQIVLGETYSPDELATERQAQRLPLPTAIQSVLSLCLDRG